MSTLPLSAWDMRKSSFIESRDMKIMLARTWELQGGKLLYPLSLLFRPKKSRNWNHLKSLNQSNQSIQPISVSFNHSKWWSSMKDTFVRLRNFESLDHLHTTRIRKACSLPHTSLQARQEVTKAMPRKRYLQGWNGTTPAACACHIPSSQDGQELLYKSII